MYLSIVDTIWLVGLVISSILLGFMIGDYFRCSNNKTASIVSFGEFVNVTFGPASDGSWAQIRNTKKITCRTRRPLEVYVDASLSNGRVPDITLNDGDIFVKGTVGSISADDGDVSVFGDVKGSVRTSDGDVVITGSVGGDVKSSDGDVTIGRHRNS